MFRHLKENRSLLMGLAIAGVVFFHASFVFHNYWVGLIHENLCCGVDLFLFFSGLGACHSIAAHGGRGYLKNRAARTLPGLYLILVPWSLLMCALGFMTWKQFFGSVTLLGWWLQAYNQLNWYFSAIWLFFLLAVPVYRLFLRTRHTLALYLGLAAVTLVLQVLISDTQYSMLTCRALVFLTGMLFGRLEQTGFSHESRLRWILGALTLFGLWLLVLLDRNSCFGLGNRLGLSWYPYALFVPGGAVLIADLASWLRRFRPLRTIMRVFEAMGQASAEILAIHMAVFKIIWNTVDLRNRWWAVTMLLCFVAGVAYREYIVKKLPIRH